MRRRFLLLLLPVLALLSGAEAKSSRSPEELVREANAAALAGDLDAAEKLYAAAEERSLDPGLIAFNKGAVSVRRGEFREAELNFLRALDDRDCPAERRVKALYNRGVCLLHRGGLSEYRTAIDSFERCLGLLSADDPLTADARHNLELAKLLWAQARAKASQKPKPNDPPKDPPPDTAPPETAGKDPFTLDQGGPDLWQPAGGQVDPLGGVGKNAAANGTDQKAPGKGNLPVLPDSNEKLKLTEEDAQQYLLRIEQRLQKDRRDTAALTTPAERPKVKDW